jgi:hypothetical protein
MSEMQWNEGLIARAISTQTLARRCVVLVDNCNWTGHECDVLGVTTDLRIIDVEVKISRADLKADAKKDKWWAFLNYTQAKAKGRDVSKWNPWDHREPVMHPRKVWKHYYAMPADIWKPELLACLPSPASGVLLVRHQRNSTTPIVVSVERRATPNKDADRLKPEQVMDIARLANLRMWEAYKREQAAREEASDFYHGRRQTLVPFQPPQQAA